MFILSSLEPESAKPGYQKIKNYEHFSFFVFRIVSSCNFVLITFIARLCTAASAPRVNTVAADGNKCLPKHNCVCFFTRELGLVYVFCVPLHVC